MDFYDESAIEFKNAINEFYKKIFTDLAMEDAVNLDEVVLIKKKIKTKENLFEKFKIKSTELEFITFLEKTNRVNLIKFVHFSLNDINQMHQYIYDNYQSNRTIFNWYSNLKNN